MVTREFAGNRCCYCGAGSTDPNLVPYPDFVSYRNNPGTAPGVEIFDAGAPKVSTINLNDPKLKMPTIYKANLSSNDLAFVFDPNDPSTPADIAASMQKVLDNPDNLAIDYIRNSMGKIADRNGGVNGWHGQWDVRLAKAFNFGASQKIELTVDAFNFLNLLNKDWGRYKTLGNQTLLTITGFDQDTQQFNYRVNENCGLQSRYSGTPWQLQLGIKYVF